MSTYELALSALADPTRRALLEILRAGPRSVSGLARELPVSRPAVSQHLKRLREARLVEESRQGTRRIFRLEAEGFEELRRYLERFRPALLRLRLDPADGREGGLFDGSDI